jgi:hypothetical protein
MYLNLRCRWNFIYFLCTVRIVSIFNQGAWPVWHKGMIAESLTFCVEQLNGFKKQNLLSGYMSHYKCFVILYWTLQFIFIKSLCQVSDFNNLWSVEWRFWISTLVYCFDLLFMKNLFTVISSFQWGDCLKFIFYVCWDTSLTYCCRRTNKTIPWKSEWG